MAVFRYSETVLEVYHRPYDPARLRYASRWAASSSLSICACI